MRKITYRQHVNLCYLYGVRARNPISFLIWKLFTKDDPIIDINKTCETCKHKGRPEDKEKGLYHCYSSKACVRSSAWEKKDGEQE